MLRDRLAEGLALLGVVDSEFEGADGDESVPVGEEYPSKSVFPSPEKLPGTKVHPENGYTVPHWVTEKPEPVFAPTQIVPFPG